MTITIDMTDEEFIEFLQFKKIKKIHNEELSGALNRVRANMEKLADTILKAVDYDWEKNNKPSVKNDELFENAVKIAADWFC